MKTVLEELQSLPKPSLGHGETRALVDATNDWDFVFRNSPSRPEHASSAVRYYMEYDGLGRGDVIDRSYVVYVDRKPVAIAPLFVARAPQGWRLSSCGADVTGPVFHHGVPEKVQKTILRGHFDYICSMARALAIPAWNNVDFCDAQGLSLWHRLLIERSSEAKFAHELYLDLRLGDEAIKQNMRKSSKSYFNQVQKYWRVEVWDRADEGAFEEFRQLHIQVAGRETRSKSTWDLQNEAVGRKEAFWISLRSHEDGQMIGAAYFMLAPKVAYYGVGAYDRTRFQDAPIGHLAQFVALKTMRDLGIEWYHLGERQYPVTHPDANDKILSIAHFKEGMASHLFSRVRTTINSDPNGKGTDRIGKDI